MIKAVVFDMGGVIHTVKPSRQKQLAFAKNTIQLLEENGIHIPDSPEEFDQKLMKADAVRKVDNEKYIRETPALESWTEYYLKEYGATREQVFPIAEELCLRWCRDRVEDLPREGLLDCAQGLYQAGMRLGIISNTLSRTNAPSLLCRYGVSGYFEYVLLSSVCGLHKPDPRIFELCRTTMGLEKDEMAYVGDTISRDLIGVRNAGWHLMIRILHPEAKPDVLERENRLENCGHTPDYVVHSLREIVDIIRIHNQTCS